VGDGWECKALLGLGANLQMYGGLFLSLQVTLRQKCRALVWGG